VPWQVEYLCGIAIKNAIHLGSLQEGIAANLCRSQSRSCVCCEEWISYNKHKETSDRKGAAAGIEQCFHNSLQLPFHMIVHVKMHCNSLVYIKSQADS